MMYQCIYHIYLLYYQTSPKFECSVSVCSFITTLCCDFIKYKYGEHRFFFYLQDNLQILRDLSLLQIQMRDIEGYRVSNFCCVVNVPITDIEGNRVSNLCSPSCLLFICNG